VAHAAIDTKGKGKRMNLDEMVEDAEEQVHDPPPSACLRPNNSVSQEKSSDERSDVGSQAVDSDYDVDEEYDNDYAENYFDNGEGDDLDDLGGGGGEDGGGGMSFYLLLSSTSV
jgi:DNA-directed RNA polymerase III subunit RPC7